MKPQKPETGPQQHARRDFPALDYVRSDQIRVLSANVRKRSITGKMRRLSPSYTKQPVNYLSSSEVTIAIAQLGHIFFNNYLTLPSASCSGIISKQELKILRNNHNIYYSNICINFDEKITDDVYTIRMNVRRVRDLSNNIFVFFNFTIQHGSSGDFTGVIPYNILR